jgi:methyl-accepting chemotaxis protein
MSMTLRTKILAVGVGGALVTGLLLLGVGLWQTGLFSSKAGDEVSKLRDKYMLQSVSGAMGAVSATGETLETDLKFDIGTFVKEASALGGIGVSAEKRKIRAVNQDTKESSEIVAPVMTLGGKPIQMVKDPSIYVPVVENAAKLSRSPYITVFQRINEEGDMLRVATTMRTEDGNRAVGTFIPHLKADGTPYPVVKTVMEGKTFQGPTMAVGKAILGCYTPMKDAKGRVIGMLGLGFVQSNVAALHDAIAKPVVGKTGELYALGTTGKLAGKYIIGPEGKEDMSDALAEKSADGKEYVKEIIDAAGKLEPGKYGTLTYKVKGKDGKPVTHIATFGYYKPWDWVVVADTSVADFNDATLRIEQGRSQMMWTLALLCLVVSGLVGLAAYYTAVVATKPITAVVTMLEDIAQGEGDLTKRLQANTEDEVGKLSAAFNTFVDKIAGVVVKVRSVANETLTGANEIAGAGHSVAQITETISGNVKDIADGAVESARSLDNTKQSMEQLGDAADAVAKAAQDQAIRLENATKTMNFIATDISAVAQTASQTSSLAIEVQKAATEGQKSVGETVDGMLRIADSTEQAGARIKELSAASEEIDLIVRAIQGISEQTNLLALNAAIEAARAGEHGRGFAVVADEVRKLSEDAATQTKGIVQLIGKIQEMTRGAETAMAHGSAEVEKGKELAAGAGDSLKRILESVGLSVAQADEVSQSAMKIDKATRNVLDDFDSLAAIAEETTASAEEMTATGTEVARDVANASEVGARQAESSSEAAGSALEAKAVADGMLAATNKLAASAQELAELMGQFKVEDSVSVPPDEGYLRVA